MGNTNYAALVVFRKANRNLEEAVLRSMLSSQLHWVALGVGILILAVGIFVSVWPLQRDQSTGSVLKANEGRPAGLESEGELPGLPARNTTGGVGPELATADDAALSDSAALESKAVEPPAPRGGPGDVANVQDRAVLVIRDAEGNIKQQETVR